MLYSQESDLSGRSEEPVVAVVLAGGGAMGLAHVGVLQVLEEEGIYPDLVIGSSMGSIIGGLYCTGYSPWEMEELFYDIDWKHVLTDSYDRSRLSFEQKMAQAQYALTLDNPLEPRLRDSGFSHGQHVMEFLDELLTGYSHEMDFDGLPIPFRAVGADLITGEEILYSQGDLKTVIRASMAVPGVFTPVNYRGRYIIDGDWVDNLPTRVARDLGADIVIAVSLYSMKDNPQDLASLEAVNYQAFQIRNVERQVESIQAADLVIAPQFHEFSFLDFENGEALIEEGYNAASSLRQEIAILADQMGKDALHFRDIDRDIAEYSISRVVVNRGESFLVEADFHEELKEYLGETANIEQLQDFLYSYYDRGDYSHFWYQIIPGINDTYTLKIDAPRRDRERESLSLGLDYSSYLLSNNVANITAHVAYRRWIGKDNDFSAGVDLSLSQFPRIQVNSQYYFLNRSINLTAETHWQQTPRLFYGEDSLSSVYGNTAYGGSLTMSIPLFRVTQFSGGIYGERHQTDHRQGEDFLIDEDWFRYGVNASMIVDTLDRVYAPKKGLNSLILFDSSLDLQQNPLNRLVIAEEVYYPFFQERLILSASWESQHLFLGNPRALEQRALGESVGMTGYFDQELPCDNGALAALDIRYRLTSLPLGLGNEVYLRLRGNSAVLWENLLPMEGEELSFHHGFSLGVMMNTIIGEASMDCSINDQNRFSVRLGLTTSSGLIR